MNRFLIFIAFISLSFTTQDLQKIVQSRHPLPHYVEGGYSPLGRAPLVDAILADPFFLPTYANSVRLKLKGLSNQNSLYDVYSTVLKASGIPQYYNSNLFVMPFVVPDAFKIFGRDLGMEMYSFWLTFVKIYHETEMILSILSPEEKDWLRAHYNAFFYGDPKKDEMEFFTTDSEMPLKFFKLGSKIDLSQLANSAKKLTLIVDAIFKIKDKIALEQDYFVWKESGLKLIVSKWENTTISENSDFFLNLGKNVTFNNNAGGTEGTKAASLFIDLVGGNTYVGENFVQGGGFLGVGVFASFAGHNTYKANSYSQGAGFMGVGLLMDLGGNNRYEINFCGQSCALFGSSLLWNKGGNSHYFAKKGMAQAASSTLGVAFLLDNEGNNQYIIGEKYKPFSGIGQGSSVGVRGDPWEGQPSFYGGLSFLYNGGGKNLFKSSWFSQGSSYFLGTGILVDEGEEDTFYADVDSQGQGLHLAAGLLLKFGGNDHYHGGWGSLGVGADRSVGMFIDTGGDDTYDGDIQSIGTSRKPMGLGFFLDLQGNDSYSFKALSNARIQRPMSPLEWSKAVFLDLGGDNTYNSEPPTKEVWGIPGHSLGVNTQLNLSEIELFDLFPKYPRINFPFDSEKTRAYQPLPVAKDLIELNEQIESIPYLDYESRRHLYETIDLFRFSHPDVQVDLSGLLRNPSKISEDQFNFAILWAIQNHNIYYLPEVQCALENGLIQSPYSRKMAIKYIGKNKNENTNKILDKVLNNDFSEQNRAQAAYYLAKLGDLETLKNNTKESEKVRFQIAKGLLESKELGAGEFVSTFFCDPSFYVRRAAALTAISLKDKRGIPILLETLNEATLDTEENYGDNVYNSLAKYVGVNFGLDKEAWLKWWNEVKNTFEF